MTRKAPESLVNELLLPWCLVCDMICELFIANQFKYESKQPCGSSDDVKPDYFISDRVDLNVKSCRVANDGEETLKHKDVDEGSPKIPIVASTSLCPVSAHLFVAEVLVSMPLQNVPTQAEGPDAATSKNDPASCVWVNFRTVRIAADDQSELGQDEGYAPVGVNVAVIFLHLTEDEEEGISNKNDKHRDVKVSSIH